MVIPTHNRSSLITRALRSVFAQEKVDLEVVVVDDGSTDGTPEALAGVADPRLRVLTAHWEKHFRRWQMELEARHSELVKAGATVDAPGGEAA